MFRNSRMMMDMAMMFGMMMCMCRMLLMPEFHTKSTDLSYPSGERDLLYSQAAQRQALIS